MVRIATSFISAAVILSSLVSARPAVQRRQDEITPAVPVVAGEGAEAASVTPIDVAALPTGIEENGSLGNSVQLPTETAPLPVEYPTAPVEQPQPVPTVIEQGGGYPLPVYGSGSVVWHQSYNECVQTCFAQHPAPPTVVTLPPSDQTVITAPEGADLPTVEGVAVPVEGQTLPPVEGNIHNVMVAPVKGVFRFVPAFLDVPVGDTVRFTWMNGPHTVTQGSAIAPCNATITGFSSQEKQAGETFEQVITDTTPQWFFCSVGAHCANGMFGAINPPKGSTESTTTVAALMPQWAAANPDIQTALDMTSKLAVNTAGVAWGNKLDVAQVPPEYHASLATSVLYTRAVIAQNPEMVGKDGVFRPTNEVIVPNDFSALIATADQGGYPEPPVADVAGPTAAANAAPVPTESPSGAGSLGSSRMAVAAVAVAAMFFAF